MKELSYNYLKYLFFALLIHIASFAKAQNLKTITLIQQRNYYLNGGARAMMGGKSRIAIRIDLPRNTRYWYYSFTTTPNEQGTQLLNLGLQVGAAVSTAGLSSAILSQVDVPPGSGSVDVLLLPSIYVTPFLNKEVIQ